MARAVGVSNRQLCGRKMNHQGTKDTKELQSAITVGSNDGFSDFSVSLVVEIFVGRFRC
jgi:hypothetical protein